MNIHQLYKAEKVDATKTQHTRGGRGEFYGGDQIYTTGFKDKVVPFSGPAHKVSNSPSTKPIEPTKTTKPKTCCQRWNAWVKSHFKPRSKV